MAQFADPWSLERTESLYGNASSALVEFLTKRMQESGWSGPPIKVFEYNELQYILDGHHRVAAAKRAVRAGANIQVPYDLVLDADLRVFGFRDVDHVVQVSCEVVPDRLRENE